jgi:hypothetical protein
MIRITSWFLLMMGSYPRGFQVPDVPGVVTAAHDERGEVGVVVRAEAQRALAGLDAALYESRAAALIALIGGLDGHRRNVISLALSDG